LLEGEGYEAALAAFRRGDIARAAALWSRDPVRAHPDRYTLQLLIACEPSTLVKIRDGAGTSSSLFLSPVQVRGRGCYRVCWGVHQSRDAAEAARSTVPASLRSSDKPLPVVLSKLAP
jgi:septal ring-binding cell division protein DamX